VAAADRSSSVQSRPSSPTRSPAPTAQACPRARPRGGRPELLHAVAAKLPRALAHVLRPNAAHAFFLGELGHGCSLFSGKLIGEEGGGQRMQRVREREMSGPGRETSGWGSLCLPVVGKHRFWVCNPFTVQHLNLGMGHRFAL